VVIAAVKMAGPARCDGCERRDAMRSMQRPHDGAHAARGGAAIAIAWAIA
jgi:hypothetical protein